MNNDHAPTYSELWRSLTPLYEPGEAKAIVGVLLESRFDLGMADVLCYGTSQLTCQDREQLTAMMQRLKAGEPVQYVLGEAVFAGRAFHVEPGVLIPRPETETLCQWVVDSCPIPHPAILDIGCGSGCIAVTLALDIPDAQVTALDISPTALGITKANALALSARVHTVEGDILEMARTDRKDSWERDFDLIVSNPPYICNNEAGDMHPNVLQHEPHLALFVPDDDPLKFYRAIAHCARKWLHTGGMLFLECNAAHIHETADMLQACGFECVETKEDLFGKARHLKATLK